jgi:rhodanese-related sulfurtransferase
MFSTEKNPSLLSDLSSLRELVLLAGILLFSGLLLGCSPTAQVEAPPAVPRLISPLDYVAQFGKDQSGILIDVRTPEEYATGHIAGSVNIAVEELGSRLAEVPEGQPVIVYCRSGNRSAAAARILVDAGYGPVYDLGGIRSWVAEGLPIQ